MSQKIVHTQVKIAGRPYNLSVSDYEEAIVKKAANLINIKYTELQRKYRANNSQDFLAMSALSVCVELLKLNNGEVPALSNDNSNNEEYIELHDKINELNLMLDQFLLKT